jgi:Prp8 binding protein
MSKRAAPQEEGTLIKRARSSEPEANNQQQIVISSSNDDRQKALIRSVKRTSNLEAPIVSLSGAHAVREFSRPMSPRHSTRRVLTGGNTEL